MVLAIDLFRERPKGLTREDGLNRQAEKITDTKGQFETGVRPSSMNGTKNNAKGFAKIDRSSVMLLEPPRAANDSPGQRRDPGSMKK